MTITKILKPELFTVETIARALYESNPDFHPRTGKAIAWEYLRTAPTLEAIAATMILLFIRHGVIDRGLVVLRPERMTSYQWALEYFLATTPELTGFDDVRQLANWGHQEEAVVSGYIDLATATLDRLVKLGVLA